MKKNILANSFIIFLLLIVNSNKLTAQLYGSFPYSESFTSGVQPSEISIMAPQSGSNSTTFTVNGMRLTAAVNNQFGAVYINNKQFSSLNGIKIEFEYGMYGGTGADGLSVFLFDASIASPVVGSNGAGLGYGYNRAHNTFAANRQTGLSGGYLGIGLDAFGNFKRQVYQGDQRSNGVQAAFTQGGSQVTLRGKRGTLNLTNGLGLGYTGFPTLITQSTLASAGTASATINPASGAYTTGGGLAANFNLRTTTFSTNPSSADYRKAFIELIPNALGGFNVTVRIQHGSTVSTVINNYWYRTSYVYTENANPSPTDFNTSDVQGADATYTLDTSPPANFRIGFGASNGGLNDIHLIRGLKVTLPYSAISNNDSFNTCKNFSATIDPLTNDLAYSGPITGTPTASSSNIDPNSFQFIDAAGTPQGVSYTQSGVGTWTYAAATKLVTFSPVTGYTGVATIRYNIKGLTAPYNDDGYRSEPATITATVNNCFGCTSALYLSQTNSLYEVVTSSNPLTYPLIGTASVNYNSTAINPLNGVMYGIQTPTSNVLVAINADGTSVNLGAVSGLPTGVTYNSGEIDNLGNYYVKVNTNNNQLYKINLSTLTATLITLSASINVPDIAFNITNGLLYGVNSTNGQLVSINPTTAVVTAIGITPGAVNFGAMFASSTGEMYGVDNLGGFYQFNLTTGQRVLISNAPASTANDGAHCVTAPISFSANLAITKTDGKATYIPGTTNTYTVVVSNNGPFGVLGATVSDPLPAGIPSGNVSYTIPVVTGGATTSITSAQTGALNDVVNLPVGGTITYTVNITIPSSFTGDLVNVATVTPPANSTDSTPANNTATDTDSSACAISATNPDSDGDGISNFCDLDDDNDGILDTVEGICDTQTVYTLNIPSTLAGATFGANGGSFNLVYTLTSGTAVASLGTSFTVPFSYSDFNNSINAQNHTWASFGSDATSFLIIPNGTSLFTGLPANNTTSENATGAVPASPDGWFRYWLDTNRITKLGTFTTTIGNLPTVSGLSSYSSNTGLNLFSSFNASSSTLVDSGYYAKMQLQNTANTANVGATLPLAVNYGNTYNWDYTAFSSTPGSGVGVAGRGLITISQNTITFCNQRDTDGDGTPDYLDLDSDGDGCPDAREGAGNFNPTTIASGTIASQTPNINFGTAVSTTTGVPTAVGAGQLVGQSQDASKNDCLDSDGDGIPDWQDLDDDNDGILDTVECTPTYLVRPVTTSSVTANKPITVGTAPQIADGEGAGGTGAGPFPNWYTNVSNLPIAFSMNMQSSSTIDHIKLYGPWGFNEWIGNFTIELYNAGNTLLGTENFVAPDQYTGTPIFSFTKEYTNVTRVRFTIVSSQGYSTVTPPRASVNEIVFLDLQPLTCDTDADGIPNHLDLDSDNDGCLDAMEGDENVTVNMLVNAASGLSVGTGSTASNQNLCASGTCVNANGVPAQVNSGGAADIGGDVGQGIGDSQNALISSGCYCYKPEVVVAGNPNPVKHGITSLNRANSGTSDWPIVRQSAWTVLESKTKGFVLNRMAFVDADSNTATPTTPPLASIPAANYVEGMMVYDTVAQCLKIYNGTIWSCFSTQTCPD